MTSSNSADDTPNEVSFNRRVVDNSGVNSPVKFEGTQSTMQGLSKLGSSRASVNTSGVAQMMRNLDQIQSEQMSFTRKIAIEHKKKEQLEIDLQDQKSQLKYYRDITKNGLIVKDDDMISKKMINKLEYQVAQARNKLSAVRKENAALKAAITEMRQEKNFHVNILQEVKKEVATNKVLVTERKDEINVVNNKKQRMEVDIANMQAKMFTDMDVFSDELAQAKRTVVDTQQSILEGIRDKLQSTFSPVVERTRRLRQPEEEPIDREKLEREAKLAEYLQQVQVGSLEELIVVLQKTEEQMFNQYNEIQSLTQETEKLEVDNKHLEKRLEDEVINLQKLEETSLDKVAELDAKESQYYETTQVYHGTYDQNLDTLNHCKDSLVGILRTISQDEDSTDQSLLAAGVNPRNLPEFLGQVEQRIDELIQMLKAANHERLTRGDFVRDAHTVDASQTQSHIISRSGSRATGGHDDESGNNTGVVRIPILPSYNDVDDDEEYPDAVLPINVNMLKDFMAKKMNNGMQQQQESPRSPHQHRGGDSPVSAKVSPPFAGRVSTAEGSRSNTADMGNPAGNQSPNSPDIVRQPRSPEGGRPTSTASTESRKRASVVDKRSAKDKLRDAQASRERAANDGEEIRSGERVS